MKHFLFFFTFLWVPAAAAEVLNLNYGPNFIDINADGVEDLITKVRWENGNAHSFDKYIVSFRRENGYHETEYVEVSLGGSYNYSFNSSEGADCILKDYLFKLNEKGFLEVASFHRMMESGDNMETPRQVEIKHYLLSEMPQFDVGISPFYLKEISTETTIKKYCDVRELTIGDINAYQDARYLKKLKIESESGDKDSSYRVGEWLEKSLAMDQALPFYETAAQQGNVKAMYHLAVYYDNNLRNYITGARWYLIAALSDPKRKILHQTDFNIKFNAVREKLDDDELNKIHVEAREWRHNFLSKK